MNAPTVGSTQLRAMLRVAGPTVAVSAAVMAAVVLLIALLLPPEYTVSTSFLHQTRQGSSTLAGVASQLGIAVPGTEGPLSPIFYGDLLNSRATLWRVLDDGATAPDSSKISAEGLIKYFGGNESDSVKRLSRALDRLDDAVTAVPNLRTAVIQVRVRDQRPDIAWAIANRLVELMNDFNISLRRGQASSERRFADGRRKELTEAVRVLEDSVETFLQSNRGSLQSSPTLAFRYDRINRRLALLRQTLLTVTQAYEQARIEEERDTPVLTLVERPRLPLRPNSKGYPLLMAAGLAAGALGGLAIVLVRRRGELLAAAAGQEA